MAQNPTVPSPTPTPNPTSNSSIEVELLLKQLEFLKDANTQLAKSFDSFVHSLNIYFAIIVAILGILAGFAGYIFGKSLKESKDIAEDIARREVNRVVSVTITQEVNRILPALKEDIKQEVNRGISETVNRRIEDIERAIDREGIIGSTSINYLLRGNSAEPKEFNFLKGRGFQDVRFCQEIQQISARYNVLVLDFVNQEFTTEQKEEMIAQINFLPQSALVIYHPFQPPIPLTIFEILNQKQVHYTPANNSVALIGRVVDAAQMAYALRHG